MSRLCPYAVPVQVPCQAYTPVMHALAGVDIPCASCACISNHKTACASTQPVCELRHVYLQKHRFVENQSYPKFMAFNDALIFLPGKVQLLCETSRSRCDRFVIRQERQVSSQHLVADAAKAPDVSCWSIDHDKLFIVSSALPLTLKRTQQL